MDFPVENEDRPQVAMTYNKDKVLRFNASSKDGKEQLLLNGMTEFVLDPSMAQNFKGFVVHREGSAYNSLTTHVPHHIETNQLIYNANRLTGFSMMENIGH